MLLISVYEDYQRMTVDFLLQILVAWSLRHLS